MLALLMTMMGMFFVSFFSEFLVYLPLLIFCCFFWMMKLGLSVSFSFFSVDYLSWFLILLSFWILMLMFLGSYSYKFLNYFFEKFMMTLMLMVFMLYMTFSSSSLISFYVFFEGSLIPIYLLILGWGYQPERLQAGLYLLLYTIFGSLPLLISIMIFGMKIGSYSFTMLFYMNLVGGLSLSIWFLISIFAFLVKLPIFFFHLWLPKAHVEAPVSGSMMLAGVLLKLGCYGLMRFFVLFDGKVMFLSGMLVSLGLVGGLFVSFICLRQTDLKSLIAYSSVSHMGLALSGLGSWGLWGFSSCLYTCIAHGLCSSGLFYLSGVIYERSSSRSMMMNKGFLELMPTMAFWWFMFCIGNLAAPVVLNLVGELGLLGSVLSFSMDSLLLLMIYSFLGACYSLYLFSSIQHGKMFMSVRSCFDGLNREYLVLLLHFFPLFFLILKVDFMTY